MCKKCATRLLLILILLLLVILQWLIISYLERSLLQAETESSFYRELMRHR